MDLAPRTLGSWRRRKRLGQLRAKLRGRPVREVTREQRAEVAAILHETGPRLGLPTLRTCCPATPPSILTDLLQSYRQKFQAEHRQIVESLHWQRPGSVWAIDHSQPPRSVDGCFSQILAVRDLASGMQLAWTPVRNASVAEVIPVMEGLVREHGPPLVLKSDNGSAFISDAMAQWLEHWQIVSLLSPVRMPQFNGACEAGIGAAKRRTEYIAARQGRYLDWTSSDLDAALHWANHESFPGGLAAGTPASRFALRQPITLEERHTFRAAVVQYQQNLITESCTDGSQISDNLNAIYHRRAVRHVLVDLAYLVIKRSSIPLPLPRTNRAIIS